MAVIQINVPVAACALLPRMDYRSYFLGASGRFLAVDEFSANNVEQAIRGARAVLAASMYPSFELWQGAAMVHKEARAASLACLARGAA